MDLALFTPVAMFAAIGFAGTELTKYVLNAAGVKAKDKRAPLYTFFIVYVWTFGTGWLFGQTRWAGEVRVGDGDVTLARLALAEVAVLAIACTALAVLGDKFLKSRDNTQTAASPTIAKPVERDSGHPDTPAPISGAAPEGAADLAGYTFDGNA